MYEEQFSHAATLYAARKYDEALQQYTSIASRHDADVDARVRAHNNASACHASVGNYAAALAAAREALALCPQHTRALLRAATACEGLRRYDEAVVYVTRARSSDTASTATRVDYDAMLTRLRARHDDAASTPATTRGGTTSTDNNNNKGNSNNSSSNNDATTHERERFYYHKSVQKGAAAATAGHYDEAVRQYSKALDRVDALDATARERAVLLCNRSAAYLHLGNADASVDDATRATDADATYARAHYRRACALHKLRRYRDAAAALRRVLELDATHAEAAALLRDVDALACESDKTAQERAADTARRVAELREQQREAAAAAASTTTLPRSSARGNGYVCCKYCNEPGHMRAECPLLLRQRLKRTRTDATC